MTNSQLYSAYLLWLGGRTPKPPQQIFDFPVANCNIFEDERSVVNRIFFLIPHVSDGQLRCFSFFEDNTFSKNDLGDLTLIRSSLHLTA